MEEEIGIVPHKPRNTKDLQPPPVAEKKQRSILSNRLEIQHSPANTLIWDFEPPNRRRG
jgi:hypothetical protein